MGGATISFFFHCVYSESRVCSEPLGFLKVLPLQGVASSSRYIYMIGSSFHIRICTKKDEDTSNFICEGVHCLIYLMNIVS